MNFLTETTSICWSEARHETTSICCMKWGCTRESRWGLDKEPLTDFWNGKIRFSHASIISEFRGMRQHSNVFHVIAGASAFNFLSTKQIWKDGKPCESHLYLTDGKAKT